MELTREQVIQALKCCAAETDECHKCPYDHPEDLNITCDTMLRDVLELLEQDSARKPDPETGLMDCGCGGKARFWGLKRKGLLRCDNCGIQTKEIAVDVENWFEVLNKQWNLAMSGRGEQSD